MNPLAHADLVHFPIVDDELQVGGVPLSQLAARVGRTPFFAYDRRVIDLRRDPEYGRHVARIWDLLGVDRERHAGSPA